MSAGKICCHSQRVVLILICISGLILSGFGPAVAGSAAQSERRGSELNQDGSAEHQERLQSIPGMMVDLRLKGPRQAVHYPSQALHVTVGMKNHGPEFMAPSTQQCFEVVVNERWYGWEHGADPFVPDEARYSRLARGDSRSVEIALTGTGDLDEVREILADRPEMAMSHLEGEVTPLQLAVQKREIDVAKLLLSLGADINATNCKGWTPLMSAAFRNHLDCAQLLLEHGAATDIKSRHFDMKALDYAKQANHTEMIALLDPVTQ